MSTLQCCSYFCQINDLLKRIQQAKTVHFHLLKGVTIPDVLCLMHWKGLALVSLSQEWDSILLDAASGHVTE